MYNCVGLIERSYNYTWFPSGYMVSNVFSSLSLGQRQLVLGDFSSGKTSLYLNCCSNSYYERLCNLLNNLSIYTILTFIGGSRREYRSISNNLSRNRKYLTSYFDGTCSRPVFISYTSSSDSILFSSCISYNGFNSYVVFDNLSNHAKIHRTLMLLLKRSPGREAYPGDVFFIHSNLLERSGRFSYFHNLGSITAIPVTETQKGITTDYITTNLISITDGSWVLSMCMKLEGLFPSIDLDLSVSRLGDSSQPEAFKYLSKRYKRFVVDYLVSSDSFLSLYLARCKYSYDLLFYRPKGSSYCSMVSLIYYTIFNYSTSICLYRRSVFALFNIISRIVNYSVLLFSNLCVC